MNFSEAEELVVRIGTLARRQDEASQRCAEVLVRLKEAVAHGDSDRVDEVAHELIQIFLGMADRYEETAGIAESLGTDGGNREEWFDLAVEARIRAARLRSLLRDGLELSLTRPRGGEEEEASS
jgi:hypothetical protein